MSTNEQLSNKTFTIPNVISFTRIILITPFVVFFLDAKYIIAGCIIILSGLSDCVDGVIARKLHQESELGKILDPLADKLTLVAVGVCLIVIDPIILPLMVILVFKDILMLIGGTSLIRKGIIPPKSKWYGKLGTVLFYITVSAIVAMQIFEYENTGLSIAMLAITEVVMLFALFKYSLIYFQLMKDYKSSNMTVSHTTAQVTVDDTKKE